jgi:uncharacterized protein (DUF1697 family)
MSEIGLVARLDDVDDVAHPPAKRDRMAAKPTVYILLFRGVGGATQLPVKPLAEALTKAGFEAVGTYINSGNAYLRTRLPKAEMLQAVAEICADRFGFRKAIHAPTLAQWRKVVADNPFEGRFADGRQLHAAWLAAPPRDEAVKALRGLARDGEALEVVGDVAYLLTPNGFGRSKFAAAFDKGIGVENTARNWNTVLKLLALAEAIAP